MDNKPPFKVKCIIAPSSGTLTEGKEYQVVSVECQADENYYQMSNNSGNLNWYFASRFEIVGRIIAISTVEYDVVEMSIDIYNG